MNRLLQTDTARLNSAADRPAAEHKPQGAAVSDKTANDFKRLMGEDAEEDGLDYAPRNPAPLPDETPDETPKDFRSCTDEDKAKIALNGRNGTQDPAEGIKDNRKTPFQQNDSALPSDRTALPSDQTALPSDQTALLADHTAKHDKQSAKDNLPDMTQDTESDLPKDIDENAFAGMTNPFSRLFSENMPKMQSSPTEAVSSSSTAELAEKLVERILVSQPDKNGQEIRLQLSQESGVNAEVRIVRGLDGSLSVTMHTKDAASFQNLVAAQDRLKATLDAHERSTVRVEVLSQTEQENNDANRRSRGYMPPQSEN